ncbi:hypothetical protein Fot_15542 [Forsythia ovata]|uniref:Uncharacterized protein n=1 Tax=Forsythia ovata TaxID=205694 RepID=A0ABD1W9I1_9LAMI
MYVTRTLSHYRRHPESLAIPPEGPNSGYLVIQDPDSETHSCFRLFKNRNIKHLPVPQNKELTVCFTNYGSTNSFTSIDPVFFIPVLNQPLSSNRYYVINPQGKHKGEAFTCSREEDMAKWCLFGCVRVVKSKPFGIRDSFQVKSVALDGFPPYFLSRNRLSISTETPQHFRLDEAPGLNSKLRFRLPEFDFPLALKVCKAVCVGKWYCPIMFIKEGRLKDQVNRSLYYEMTLEQTWKQIFTCQNEKNQQNSVLIDVTVDKEVVFVGGNKVMWYDTNVVDRVMWFTSIIGLRMEIVERMKWEQARGGWRGGEERQVKIKRVEEFKGSSGWKKFGCYVLVERFVLKRMDRSLAMTYSFFHTHQLKCKWE